jgi:hypothetical protein
LPWLVGILLPFEAAMLFLFRQTPSIVFETLFLVLLTPPIMAAFVAATAGKSGDSYGVTPLIATRPLTNASLIAVKLKATMGSTLAAWLLVLVAIPLALRLSGAAPLVIERAHRLVEALGMPRAVAIVLLGLLALVASTWKQLVLSLSIGLSGREWVVKASVFGTLTFLGIALPLAHWISEDRYAMGVLWNAFPWIAAVLAIVKISTAAWIAMRLRERRLVSDRALVIGAVCWDAAVFALFGLLVWILPTLIFPTSLLALLAILAIPLARLSAAPLALAWNRHR